MNNSIKCIIVDDEQLAIDTLKWQLSEFCEDIIVASTFTNPNLALQYLQNNSIDLCFLDIDMPEKSGFEVLEHWNNNPPFDVIFATAYSEFAIQAFKVSAVDYLLKPIDEEDLVETIKKYRLKKHPKQFGNQLSLLLNQINSSNPYPSRIALPTLEGIHMIDTKNITRLEADNNYTTVYLATNQKIIVSKTLKEVEAVFDPNQFFRIHQSHCIHLSKIDFYQRGRGGSVTLQDGTILPVSKNRKEELLKRLGM